MSEYKIPMSNDNTFFNLNKIGLGTAAPTSGTYKVGDFIVSSSQINNIFGWVCTVAGTPGTWEVIKSGDIDLTPYATKSDVGTVSSLSTTDKTVVGAINELFQNANNGKSTIATAIGSPLASTDTFAAMGTKINTIKSTLATNIKNKGVSASNSETMTSLVNKVKNITSAKDIKVDGTAIGSNFELSSTLSWSHLDNTIKDTYYGAVVVFNNEIHTIGGNNNAGLHYKWDGTSWTYVSTLPYSFKWGSAVVYNNEIHILGGYDYDTKHYKWNGSTWTSVSTLPYSFYWHNGAVVYNNEIHIVSGSGNITSHYKWNGSTWTSVSTTPYGTRNGSVIVYNNEIHMLGGNWLGADRTNHYKWNGSTWTSVSTLPYGFYNNIPVVYNNELHIMSGPGGNLHYKWDGNSWTKLHTLVESLQYAFPVVYNDNIHLFGGSSTSNQSLNHLVSKKLYEII